MVVVVVVVTTVVRVVGAKENWPRALFDGAWPISSFSCSSISRGRGEIKRDSGRRAAWGEVRVEVDEAVESKDRLRSESKGRRGRGASEDEDITELLFKWGKWIGTLEMATTRMGMGTRVLLVVVLAQRPVSTVHVRLRNHLQKKKKMETTERIRAWRGGGS